MAVTYSFKITNLELMNNIEGYNNVVTRAFWTLTGVDGDYSEEFLSSTEFPAPGEEFESYETLTEETVIGWVEEHTPEDYITHARTYIADQIALKQAQDLRNAPVLTTAPLPWATLEV